ncbi:MAG TPA: PEP-CTERM sorting domain-containing protein, partial [Verrucomicrobiota bacterium]|nr:PEP-CTERM sorting domain-containing protein [Verrucomicrobiota bacterium]
IWDMNWVIITTPELLIPDATTYRLQFTSLVPGAAGPALDRVELQIVPEPSVAGLLLVLAVGGAFHQRRLKRA